MIKAFGHFANNQIKDGIVTWIQGGFWELKINDITIYFLTYLKNKKYEVNDVIWSEIVSGVGTKISIPSSIIDKI